ncbi:MAG TPA: DUF4159 domain-containing protein [Tepidisphaeraceae bacterium]
MLRSHGWLGPAALIVSLFFIVTPRSPADGPTGASTTPRPPGVQSSVTDDDIGRAIARGRDFLLAQFEQDEIKQGRDVSQTYHEGLNALCVYAVLCAGQATHDSRFQPTDPTLGRLVEAMKRHPMATDRDKPQSPAVYARSLRASALAVYARPDDRDVLADDVQWLVDAAVGGAYSYDDRDTFNLVRADPREAPRERQHIGSDGGTSPTAIRPPMPNGTSPTPTHAGPGVSPPRMVKAPAGRWIPIRLIPWRRIDYRPPPWSRGRFIPRTPTSPTPAAPTPRKGDTVARRNGGASGVPQLPPPNYPPQELNDPRDGLFQWDNSNSQYGVMGVWAGAEVGMEVPDAYWEDVEAHWLDCQRPDGQWTYRADKPAGTLAMTLGGAASVMITRQALEAPTAAARGQQSSPAADALGRAIAWLSQGDHATDVGGPGKVYLGYTLFALGRVGLLSGYKFLGEHDWYPEMARKVVQSQWDNGAWGRTDQATADTLIDTAYTVLFLARGRHPILMNKLALDPPGSEDHGRWNNRPRDLSNLARFASRELERPIQWQIVPLARPATDWSDAPILYLASDAALKLSVAEVNKIRTFVDQGGILFTQADDGSAAFNLYVEKLCGRLFPGRTLAELPREHPIYTAQYTIPISKRPRLRGILDAKTSRPLWIHSPSDLATAWQQRMERTRPEAFELGVNLFLYAGGKDRLRNRGDVRAR